MHESPLITDSDLARARKDADFRQKILTERLECLLAELSKLQRHANNTAACPEGVEPRSSLPICCGGWGLRARAAGRSAGRRSLPFRETA
jgi:hypothetical protein